MTQDEVRSSTLKPLEKDDVCDYLIGTYRAEADQLRDDLDDSASEREAITIKRAGSSRRIKRRGRPPTPRPYLRHGFAKG